MDPLAAAVCRCRDGHPAARREVRVRRACRVRTSRSRDKLRCIDIGPPMPVPLSTSLRQQRTKPSCANRRIVPPLRTAIARAHGALSGIAKRAPDALQECLHADVDGRRGSPAGDLNHVVTGISRGDPVDVQRVNASTCRVRRRQNHPGATANANIERGANTTGYIESRRPRRAT